MFSGGIEKQHRAVMSQNYNTDIIHTNKLLYWLTPVHEPLGVISH